VITYLDSQTVSAEYVYWQQDEMSVRALLRSTNIGMARWFDETWEATYEHANAIFNPDYHDAGLPAELFQEEVGVWPDDYFWQLSSAVVKDACSLYEAFLERIAHAVLRSAGAGLHNRQTESSWRWEECELFFAHYVGVDVSPPNVDAVLWIRNKLTHLRDELRTDAGRREFAAHVANLGLDAEPTLEEQQLGLVEHRPYMHFGGGVNLTQLQTWRLMDVIAEQVGIVALATFPFLYRRATNPYLDALRAKQPTRIQKFNTNKLIDY
jgi:hypothetical protein